MTTKDKATILAHILWQVAKQLVSLLEQEFGFQNRKERRDE